MKIIWHGTASIELRSEGQTLLVDPFVPLPGSAAPVRLEDFDGFDHVLVTHGHIDHISSLPQIVRRNPGMTIWCTQTPWRTLRRKGVPESRLRRIDFGQTLRFGDITVETFHGKHAVLPRATPGRVRAILRNPNLRNLPDLLLEHLRCRENDETVFYRVTAQGQSICLMGSLNLRDEVRYPVGDDVLILPYNGWEDNLPPAVAVVERLQPQRILLDHYDDTFPPLTGPLELTPILEKYPGRVRALDYNTVTE